MHEKVLAGFQFAIDQDCQGNWFGNEDELRKNFQEVVLFQLTRHGNCQYIAMPTFFLILRSSYKGFMLTYYFFLNLIRFLCNRLKCFAQNLLYLRSVYLAAICK